MALLNAQTVNRLKSQLLTSGLQQKDQPLFQVINQLIDSLSTVGQTVDVITGGGGGGGGAALNQRFVTYENDLATLPNSRQLVAGAGITINRTPTKLILSAAGLPLSELRDEDDCCIPIPGPKGDTGPQGPQGPPGLDGECNCEALGALLAPVGLEYLGTWYDYDVVWDAVTASPSLGDGTIEGRYMKIGRTVWFNIILTAGGTTTFGTGLWTFTVPFALRSLFYTAICQSYDADTTNRTAGWMIPITSTTVAVGNIAAGGGWQSNNPIAVPATGDVFNISGIYEEA